MAEKNSKMPKRAGSSSSVTSGPSRLSSRSNTKDLLSREEEYKRLNEELEAKTALLIKDAEDVIKGQESLLEKPSLLDNINTDDFFGELADDELTVEGTTDTYREKVNESTSRPPTRPISKSSSNLSRPTSSKSKRPSSSKISKKKSSAANDVAVPDDAFLTEFKDFSFSNAINDIEKNLGDNIELRDSDEDVLPSVAAEMGSEAQIRFLKAKLRVMQEELDRLADDYNKKEEEVTKLNKTLKTVEEDKNRLVRTSASQQSQIDKYKKIAEDAKSKADSLEGQLSSVKKELEGIKRSQKQQATNQGATEVRLNRALEEIEKYKVQLAKAKTDSKDVTEHEKRRVEQLLIENRRLEKQKNELMTGFKKQLKLIDILKRQKMHIEAAKMLQFSEEEFVKSLEWGSLN